jgi:hypothetical protein
MKKFLLALSLLFFTTGCSFVAPPNAWQSKSAVAFDSYSKNYLRGADALAQSDLQRAIEHAQSSAQLQTLGRIYLGACALNVSVGKSATCHDFKEVQELLQDPSLQAYYNFIEGSLLDEEIDLLPKEYQAFSWHVKSLEYDKAFASLKDAKITSKLLASALIREHLTQEEKEQMLDEASFYGYKKAVLFWIEEIEKTSQDEEMKQKMKKMRNILAPK